MNADIFSIKRPCANCPFRSDENAIQLEPGRLAGIIQDLLKNDQKAFWCHKAYYAERSQEKFCAGAATYLYKAGRPSISMRFLMIADKTNYPRRWQELAEQII